MAFNLYFAGSQCPEADIYLKNHNANRLASQLNDRSLISSWSEHLRTNPESTSHLFIDSGAFSAHTKNSSINVDEYINYLNNNDDVFYIFAQVDKIPGVFRQPKTKEQLLEAPELSWKNYLYMRPKLKSPDKLIPIFHQGEDIKWLHNMLEFTIEGYHIPYIGISPANDKSTKEKIIFIEKCFDVIKNSSNPNVKTHAFGMTSLKVLESYPFTSADSTSWIMTGANGGIMTKWGIITVSENHKNDISYYLYSADMKSKLSEYVKSQGFDLEQLSTDYKQRILFNIKYLLNWAANYKYKPKPKKAKLF